MGSCFSPEQIGFVGKLQHVKIYQESFAVGGLLVVSGIVDESDAIEAVLGGIISDTEFAADLFAPAGGGFVVATEPNEGFWGDDFGSFHLCIIAIIALALKLNGAKEEPSPQPSP
jgi:hypothetical protein